MTNHMIKAEDIASGTRFDTADDESHICSRVRMIDHERLRIDTREGRVIICKRGDAFHLTP